MYQPHVADATGGSDADVPDATHAGGGMAALWSQSTAMRPDLYVMTAAYGQYGPGYIGTAASYPEGAYETSPTSSSVAPKVEGTLTEAIKKLLQPN